MSEWLVCRLSVTCHQALTALLEHCLLSQCDLHMDDELLLAAAKGSRNAADESGYGEVIRLLVAFERSQCAIDQALMQACRGSYLFDRRRAPNAAVSHGQVAGLWTVN